MAQRTYYDHEEAYRRIAQRGGTGWDDNFPGIVEGSYQAIDAFLQSAWAPQPAGNALDLGCGGGQVTLRLARLGYRAHGIDFAETAIALSKRNAEAAGLTAHFSTGDALTLDGFADGSMQLVVDNHVLHCLVTPADRQSFLRSARRVLAPGGRLFSETMTREGDFDGTKVQADPVSGVGCNGHRIWITEAAFLAELAQAGLTVLFQERRAADPGGGENMVVYATPET